jgi:hypothetical protein
MYLSSLFTGSAGQRLHRRAFLRAAGASGATAALVLAGCSDDSTPTPIDPYLLTLGSGDVGLLNYAYLLEQLEATLYQKVVDAPPADLQPGDLAFFTDLRDHELIHREALLFALGTVAIPTFAFDFSSLTLTTRAGVIAAAKTFEELGVAAYNGILPLVSNATVLTLLSKITSVEARHAAFISDLITPGSFAGTAVVVNDGNLLSVAASQTPTQVIAATAAFFLPVKISIDSLPTV